VMLYSSRWNFELWRWHHGEPHLAVLWSQERGYHQTLSEGYLPPIMSVIHAAFLEHDQNSSYMRIVFLAFENCIHRSSPVKCISMYSQS
jgi:hypothetical protein